jgi:hypothetical protein
LKNCLISFRRVLKRIIVLVGHVTLFVIDTGSLPFHNTLFARMNLVRLAARARHNFAWWGLKKNIAVRTYSPFVMGRDRYMKLRRLAGWTV